jgi:GNAT superfamily N-acetyltransferase
VRTDGSAADRSLSKIGYEHNRQVMLGAESPAHVTMSGVHRVASLVKRWILGMHHGSVQPGHLDAHLDEFVFRFNRRTFTSRGMLFYRRVQQAVVTAPVRYHSVVQGLPTAPSSEQHVLDRYPDIQLSVELSGHPTFLYSFLHKHDLFPCLGKSFQNSVQAVRISTHGRAIACGKCRSQPEHTQPHRVPKPMTSADLLPDAASSRNGPTLLRPHRPGDIGWVISRHGALYASEYAWDLRFEALVARIAADFIDRFDPQREACWIAERDGVNVGSVFLVQARDEATHEPIVGVAQLRMLLVEPAARGLGLGRRLVEECERFARLAGYRKIILWTNANLLAARGIYRTAGYALVNSETHRSFGHELVGEHWELLLS